MTVIKGKIFGGRLAEIHVDGERIAGVLTRLGIEAAVRDALAEG